MSLAYRQAQNLPRTTQRPSLQLESIRSPKLKNYTDTNISPGSKKNSGFEFSLHYLGKMRNRCVLYGQKSSNFIVFRWFGINHLVSNTGHQHRHL